MYVCKYEAKYNISPCTNYLRIVAQKRNNKVKLD